MNYTGGRSFNLNSDSSAIPRSEIGRNISSPLSNFLIRTIFAITIFSCVMLMKNSSDVKVRNIYEAICLWAECSYSVPEEFGIEKFVSLFKDDPAPVSGNTNVSPLSFPTHGKVTVHYGDDNCRGIIISSGQDEFIFPSASGIVKEVSSSEALGSYIVTECADGVVITYGLLNSIGVDVGDEVDAKTILASMTKGSDESYHAYMEVSINGNTADPELCFAAASV